MCLHVWMCASVCIYAYSGLFSLSSGEELSAWMLSGGRFSLPNIFYTISGGRHLASVIWLAMSENLCPRFAFIS